MSDLADKASQILKEIDELGLDAGGIPEEIENLGPDSSEEDRKKANHAFAQIRERLKTTKELIQEQGKKIEELEQEKTQTSPSASQSSAQTPEQQTQFYLATLQTRAMQKLGIADVNHPLVQYEINRLYNLDMAQAEERVTAEEDAVGILNTAFSEFPMLSDEDKEAIKKNLSAYDSVARKDVKLVKGAIHAFIGENLDRFKGATNSQQKSKSSPQPGSDAGAAAASSVKAKGSGVQPGGVLPDGGSDHKPATVEERKEMKKLGLTPDKIELYRKAKQKKGKYSQQ